MGERKWREKMKEEGREGIRKKNRKTDRCENRIGREKSITRVSRI